MIKLTPEKIQELLKLPGTTVLPSKGVFTIKKKQKEAEKKKCRIVACGNFAEKKKGENNYAGGADATAIRIAVRRAALENWTIASKDVSTAFLNADYATPDGSAMLINPQIGRAHV